MNQVKFSGYTVVLGALIVLFAHNGALGTIGVFMPAIAKDLPYSVSQISLVITFASVVAFIGSLFVGKLIQSISAKWMLFIGTLTCSLHYFLYGISYNLWTLYLAASIAGFTMGCATTACCAAIIKSWFIEKRATMIGYIFGGATLGNACFMYMSGLLIANIGWRNTYFVIGAAVAVIGLLVNLIFIRTPEKLGQKPLGWEKQAEIEAELAKKSKNARGLMLSKAMKTPAYWLIFFGMIVCGLTSVGFKSFAPAFWQENGMDPVNSALLVSVYQICAAAGVMISGKIAEKFGNKIFIAYLSVFFAIGVTFVALSDGNLSTVLVGGSILFAALAMPLYTSVAATITTGIFGSLDYEKITATLTAGLYIGLAAVAPMIGLIKDFTGSYVPGFSALGVLALIAMICFLIALSIAPMKKVILADTAEEKKAS